MIIKKYSNEQIIIQNSNNNINIIITADSLLTASTITLIAFTNFSPGSTPSGSVIKRAYWSSRYLSTDVKRRYLVCWLLFSSFLNPIIIISVTTITTIIEVILSFGNFSFSNDFLLPIPFGITAYLQITALSRFVIFHKNPNKNTAIWFWFQYEKISDTQEEKSKSLYLNMLSFFRATENFELINAILHKIKKERERHYNNDKISTKSAIKFLNKNDLFRPKINKKTIILLMIINLILNKKISNDEVKLNQIKMKLEWSISDPEDVFSKFETVLRTKDSSVINSSTIKNTW
ncbi:MAG: hypothetical protein HRT99_03745 [Mycoplasmatales bacterium]|nr:hypothetical protein [Mycoplasmatales bacterium]